MTTETVRVVYATVCESCEGLVGTENVRDIKKSTVDNWIAEKDDTLVQYHDRHHNALFRKLSFDRHPRC